MFATAQSKIRGQERGKKIYVVSSVIAGLIVIHFLLWKRVRIIWHGRVENVNRPEGSGNEQPQDSTIIGNIEKYSEQAA